MTVTKVGGVNMSAHAQWQQCPPFPRVAVFYVTPELGGRHLRIKSLHSDVPDGWNTGHLGLFSKNVTSSRITLKLEGRHQSNT